MGIYDDPIVDSSSTAVATPKRRPWEDDPIVEDAPQAAQRYVPNPLHSPAQQRAAESMTRRLGQQRAAAANPAPKLDLNNLQPQIEDGLPIPPSRYDQSRTPPEVLKSVQDRWNNASIEERQRALAAISPSREDFEAETRGEFQQEMQKDAAKELGQAWFPNAAAANKQAGAGLASLGARLTGNDEAADILNRYSDAVGQVAGERDKQNKYLPPAVTRGFRNSLSSLTQSAIGGAVAGPYGAIGVNAAAEGNQAITEARDAGLAGTDVAKYAASQAAIEGSVGAVMQKAGLGGVNNYFKSTVGQQVVQGGIRQALKRAGVAALQELPEELVTELGHSVARKMSGVDPNALSAEALQQTVFDTTLQTLMTVGMAASPDVAMTAIESKTNKKRLGPISKPGAQQPVSPQPEVQQAETAAPKTDIPETHPVPQDAAEQRETPPAAATEQEESTPEQKPDPATEFYSDQTKAKEWAAANPEAAQKIAESGRTSWKTFQNADPSLPELNGQPGANATRTQWKKWVEDQHAENLLNQPENENGRGTEPTVPDEPVRPGDEVNPTVPSEEIQGPESSVGQGEETGSEAGPVSTEEAVNEPDYQAMTPKEVEDVWREKVGKKGFPPSKSEMIRQIQGMEESQPTATEDHTPVADDEKDVPDEEPESKEPWQMSLQEFGKSKLPDSVASKITQPSQVDSFRGQHLKEIQGAIDAGKTIPPEVLAEYPDLVKKNGPETTAPAAPWHADREAVFQSMRDLQTKVDASYQQLKRLQPKSGTIGVGNADFDPQLNAAIGESYLSTIRKGGTPDQALAAATASGNETVQKWNSQGSKGRASFGGKETLHRWEGAGQSIAENIHRIFIQSVAKNSATQEPQQQETPPPPKKLEPIAAASQTAEAVPKPKRLGGKKQTSPVIASQPDVSQEDNSEQRSKNVVPLSHVKTSLKKAIDHNVAPEDSNYASDGRVLIDRRSLSTKTSEAVGKLKTNTRGRYLNDDRVKDVLGVYSKSNNSPVEFLGVTPETEDTVPHAVYLNENGNTIDFDSGIVAWIDKNVDHDKVTSMGKVGKKDNPALVFWKDNTPVAIVMSFNQEKNHTLVTSIARETLKTKNAELQANKKGLKKKQPAADKGEQVQSMTATPTPSPATPDQQEVRSSPNSPTIPSTMEGEVPENTISAHSIVASLGKMFNVPIRTGRVANRKALGIYKQNAEVVRTTPQADADLAVISHEVAHHIDNTTDIRTGIKGLMNGDAMTSELKKLDYEPEKARDTEGFAEFMRILVTRGDQEAEAAAPTFYNYLKKDWLPKHPDTQTKINDAQKMVTQWREQGAYARAEASVSKTGFQDQSLESWKEKLPQYLRNSWNRFYSKWKDRSHAFKLFDDAATKAGYKLGDGENPSYDLETAFNNAGPAHISRAIQDGVFSVTTGDKLGPSLKDVLAPIKEGADYNKFRLFAWARHSLEVYAKKPGMNPGLSKQDAEHIVADVSKDPELLKRYTKAAEGLTEFGNSMLDMMVDAGVISADSSTWMQKQWETHIPLLRAKDKFAARSFGSGIVNQPDAVKRRFGSGRQILDPVESLIQLGSYYYDRALQQQVLLQMAKQADPALGGAHGMGTWMERVNPNMKVTHVGFQEILPAMQKKLDDLGVADQLGLDEDAMNEIGDHLKDDFANIYRPDYSPDDSKHIIRLVIENQPVMYQVDPDLHAALTDANRVKVWAFLRVFPAAANVFKLGATGLSTGFAFANVGVDWVALQTNSKYLKGLSSTYMPFYWAGVFVNSEMNRLGIKTGQPDQVIQLWKEAAGHLSTITKMDIDGKKKLREELFAHSTPSALKQLLIHPIDTIRDVVGISEVGPRLAEFAAALEHLGYERSADGKIINSDTGLEERPPRNVIVESIKASNEVTLNFKRQGSYGQTVNQFIPFFNATLESTDKSMRVMANSVKGAYKAATGQKLAPSEQNWKRAMVSLSSLAAASLIYALGRVDDDDYLEQEEWLKRGYWSFSRDGQTIMRVKKNQEYSFIPNAIESMLEANRKGSVKPISEALSHELWNRMPFNRIPLVTPLIENFANKEIGREKPIETPGMKRLRPGDRYTPYNTELVKAIGDYTNTSPAKIEHFIDSSTAGMYQRTYGTAEKIAMGKKDIGLHDAPFVRAFVSRKNYDKSTNEFYSEMDRMSQEYESAKQLVKQGKIKQVPEAVEQRFHKLQEYAELMQALRSPIAGERDRMARFGVERYIVGLSRDALGEEPLENYPNPLKVSPQDLPDEVRAETSKYYSRMEKRIARQPVTKKSGETPEMFEQRQVHLKSLKSRANETLAARPEKDPQSVLKRGFPSRTSGQSQAEYNAAIETWKSNREKSKEGLQRLGQKKAATPAP